jgi:UDP-N-acetylmuramoyl-tripeptide--D-alanyl-D-alanine ligase
MPVTINKRQLCEVIKGEPVVPGSDSILGLGLNFDSRDLKGGEIFIALPGETTHGHEFLVQAADRGASLFIIEDKAAAEKLPDKARAIVVKSSQQALYDLASWWRETLNVFTIAITGSAGKTTTKELLRYILSETGQGTWSLKSHNNHVGVPYTILRASREDHWLVLEMGMNHPGEIATLSKCARPDIAVVTTVAPAHIEFFDSLEDIAREKLSIADGMRKGEGTLIVNAECDALMKSFNEENCPYTVFKFGKGSEAEVAAVTSIVKGDSIGIEFEVKLFTEIAHVALPIAGKVNALNAAAALLAAKSINPLSSLKNLTVGLEKFQPPDGRLKCHQLNESKMLIDDSYNANPASMLSTIDVAHDLVVSGKDVVLILGEMRELGDHSERYHQEIGAAAAASGASACIFVDPVAHWYREGAKRSGGPVQLINASSAEEAADLASKLDTDTYIVKASRGARLDKTVNKLIADSSH